MKNKFIFIVLIIGILCCSISTISASNSDIALNQSDEIVVSDYSNLYSFNNADINNVVQSDIRDDGSNSQIEGAINTEKQSTYINTSNIELYYKNGTRFEAYLYDVDNNPLEGQILTFTINGVHYDRVTNEYGKASVPVNLIPNNYVISVTFNGTELYNSCSAIGNALVISTVISNNLVKYYKNGSQYCAKFLDDYGNPLVGVPIRFNIHGVFYDRVTNASGMAKLNINLSPGEYIITAIQSNNGLQYSNNISIYSTIIGKNLTKAFQDSNQYCAKFLDDYGNPLVGVPIRFNIHGVFYDRVTNASGMAKLNINLSPGEYIITAIQSNNGLQYSNNIIVLTGVATQFEIENITLRQNLKQTIPVILYDEIGYTLPNKTVSLQIYKTWYEAVTNANGVAYFDVNLTAGSYTALCQFNGTNVYSPSAKETIIVVKKGKDVLFEVNETIFNQGEKFYLSVKDMNGTPLNDTKVIFNINGVKYERYTNSMGVASIEINLNPNQYTITYYVNKTNYDDTPSSTTISIISTNQTNFSTNTTEVYKGEGQKFYVVLKAGTVPLANQKITIVINNIPYTRTTNSQGVASITINLAAGNYPIIVYYNGTNKVKPTNNTFNLKVLNLSATKFTVTSGFDIETGKLFSVMLSDSEGNGIPNKIIKITINGETNAVTTNGDGVATLNISLPVGTYGVVCKFEREYPYGSTELSTEIRVIKGIVNGNGYWLFGRDMLSADLQSLANQGTGNIFLNFAAFSTYGEAKVVNWIKEANKYGIKVHIWMQAFYNGAYINPVLADGSPNTVVLNEKINEAKYYASVPGVAGIHLDYLRYPGTAYKYPTGTSTINNFVKSLTETVRAINPNIILSAAVMPETTSNIYYYGQDVNTLGQYLDVIVPMIYKGNYNSGTAWITSTTKWFVDNSNGAQIWTGLQAYASDDNPIPLSTSELTKDAQAAITGNAVGVVMFRWGLTNFIDFKNLNYPSTPDAPSGTVFSVSNIKEASKEIKSYMESNGVLPSAITIGNSKCSPAQALYLMNKFISNYKKQSEFSVIDASEPINPPKNTILKVLSLADYTKLATSIVNYMESYKSAPEYMASAVGNIPYSSLIYAYARVIVYDDVNGALPWNVFISNIVDNYTLEVTMMPSVASQYKYIYYKSTWLGYCPKCGFYGTLLNNPKHVPEGEITCAKCDADYCGVTGKDKLLKSNIYLTRLTGPVAVDPVPNNVGVSINGIQEASIYVKGYYEANGEIPDSISILDGKFTNAQYLYLVSKAITNIGLGNFSDIEMVNVSKASNPNGNVINSQLYKDEYLDVVNRVVNFIEKEGQAPNYASSDLGKINYEELVESFSRILAYYADNGELPNYVTIVYGGGSSKNIYDLSISLISGLNTTKQKATALYNYVRDYITYIYYQNTQKGAAGTLASGGGNCCDQAQLLVAMARSVNLTVRFEHGSCRFSSGSLLGHVWVQFLIDGTWVNADPTSSRNSLGVINNWNTATYTHKAYYDVLPF